MGTSFDGSIEFQFFIEVTVYDFRKLPISLKKKKIGGFVRFN